MAQWGLKGAQEGSRELKRAHREVRRLKGAQWNSLDLKRSARRSVGRKKLRKRGKELSKRGKKTQQKE